MNSNPKSSIDEILTEVHQSVTNINHTNSDLLALTVEVEDLRVQLRETVTEDILEVRRRTWLGVAVGGSVVAAQVADWHIETCRINPIIGRFQNPTGVPEGKHTVTVCDVTFPTHNHLGFYQVGKGLDTANIVGIVLYSVLAVALFSWWFKSKLKVINNNKRRQREIDNSNQRKRIIYSSPKQVSMLELDPDGKETRHILEKEKNDTRTTTLPE